MNHRLVIKLETANLTCPICGYQELEIERVQNLRIMVPHAINCPMCETTVVAISEGQRTQITSVVMEVEQAEAIAYVN